MAGRGAAKAAPTAAARVTFLNMKTSSEGKKINASRHGRGRHSQRSEVSGRSAAVESGNRARNKDVVRVQRLRKQKIQRNEDGHAGRCHAGDFFEADALATQL